MTRLTIPIIAVFFLTIASCTKSGRRFDSNGLRQEIIDTLLELERFDAVPGGVTGYRGEPSVHLETTDWFEKSITRKEAEILFKHENTFIKSIAFEKMWSGSYPKIFDVIIDSYSDTLMVYQEVGCEHIGYRLFDYYIMKAGYPFRTMEANKNLTTRQKEIIDSLATTKDYWIKFKKRMPPM